MKLLFAATSPFVRKVVVLAAETGLSGDIERIDINPVSYTHLTLPTIYSV